MLGLLADEGVHPLYIPLPEKVLGDPDNNKDRREDPRIGEDTGKRVFHPVRKVGDRQHDDADGQKVYAALLCKAPGIKLPDNRRRRKACTHNCAQYGLQNDRIQLVSHCADELRRDRIKRSVPNAGRNNQRYYKSNGNSYGQSEQPAPYSFLFHFYRLTIPIVV